MSDLERVPRILSRFAAAAALAVAGGAPAQLIGPIPSATPPTPDYVPPPPAPRIDVPETDPIAPSIVERTDDGRLKPLTGNPDEIAVERYPFTEAERAKIRRSIEARRLDLDRFVANNVAKVLAARALTPQVEQAAEFGPLFQARDAVASLRFERLLERLERDQAISLGRKNRVEEALREYDRARKDQIEKDTGGDPMRITVLVLRQSFKDATLEPFESLDRQTSDLAFELWRYADELTLRSDQKDRLEQIRSQTKPGNPDEAHSPEALARAKRFVGETLDTDQRRAAMLLLIGRRTPPPAEPGPRKPEPRPRDGH